MSEYLYRFRSADKMLERKELELQEIFFASPDKLNDPVEGYKDIFWSGDEIAWKNLLKHYLLCLEHICNHYILVLEEDEIKPDHIPVFKSQKNFPTEKYKKLYEKICELFFSNENINQYPKWMSNRKSPIRRNELLWYLGTIHRHAIYCIFSVYHDGGLLSRNWIDKNSFKPENLILDFEKFDVINQLEEAHPDKPDGVELFLHFHQSFVNQLNLIFDCEDKSRQLLKNRKLIFLEFSEKYLQQLEKILYHNWYVACFSGSFQNSSMWGNYAKDHTGVCLKFKVRTDDIGSKKITLKGINGYSWNNGNKDKIIPNYLDREEQFFEVKYQKKYPEIDFFRSIGRLSVSNLYSSWMMDENGNKSICCDAMEADRDSWHKNYWEKYYECITTKTEDWNYEKEYRVILSSFLTDYTAEKSSIKPSMTYKFEDLEGIIFGIKTTHEHKLQIIRIIEEKCIKENRTDFKFFQAYYSNTTGKIDTVELTSLKFSIKDNQAND